MSEADPERMTIHPIGERLRKAREDQGLTLEDIANRTRIPIRHLQHIEKGEWDALPATTYSIGFARSYANVVGLNGSEIGVELREQLGHTRPPAAAAAYYEPADPARVPPRSLALIAGVIALLLVIGYVVWRSGAVDDSALDENAASGIETPLAEPEPAVAPPGPAQPLGGPTAADAAGPVILTATDTVWLRVYEADGERLFENTLQAGQRFVVPSNAERPQILTGRPNALRVTVGNAEIPPLGGAEETISGVSLTPVDLLARVRGAAPAAPAPTPPPAG
ncbi:helix-turn-helix domain-containing protein [Enterovirga sp. GCM10030262]|uniref:helix-turn-helix domain-containing protein n=1 Tax=Enterovirga sp. GCM10030262 TaxID=3273391 RepID=UPI003606D5C1